MDPCNHNGYGMERIEQLATYKQPHVLLSGSCRACVQTISRALSAFCIIVNCSTPV